MPSPATDRPDDYARWLHLRGRVAGLSRDRAADDPEYLRAQQDLKATRTEIYLRRIVNDAPRLTPEALDKLALILLRGRGEARV